MTCACHATDPYACWASRYDVERSAVPEDGGPCVCACHEGQDEDADGWAAVFREAEARLLAWGPTVTFPAALSFGGPRRFGRSSRAKQRRARRRADIQLIRKLTRRGVCPCGDTRIDDPGPHLAACRYLNEEADECPF